METTIGKVMNIENNGVLITRGLVVEVKGNYVTIKERDGRTDEWPIGTFYQLVEC